MKVCSVSHAMSSFQSLCSTFCFVVQQLFNLLFYLFRGSLLSDLYIFPCWKKLSFLSLPFCTVRYNMLPHNGEETLLPVTFLHWGCPEFWVVPHTLGCMAASSVPAVRILFISTERTMHLIVGLVSVPVSQCKQKIQGVLNPICCLSAIASEYVNLTWTYIINIRKKPGFWKAHMGFWKE